MKIRLCYVSNSSSSSYVCDICGQADGGYEITLDEANMYQCERWHVFCKDHAIGPQTEEERAEYVYKKRFDEIYFSSDYYVGEEEKRAFIKEIEDLYEKKDYKSLSGYFHLTYDNDGEYIIEEACPICNRADISQHDLLSFLKCITGLRPSDVLLMFQKNFKSYDDLKDYLNKNEKY